MSLNWKCRDTRDGDILTASIGGMKITVQDCDGDFARWWITEGETTIAHGDSHALTPDYTDHAMAVAEEAARVVLRFRKRGAVAEQPKPPHRPDGFNVNPPPPPGARPAAPPPPPPPIGDWPGRIQRSGW